MSRDFGGFPVSVLDDETLGLATLEAVNELSQMDLGDFDDQVTTKDQVSWTGQVNLTAKVNEAEKKMVDNLRLVTCEPAR